MRVSLFLTVSLGLVACTGSDVRCVDRPTDPLCQDVDSGGGDDGGPGDTGVDAPMGDAHVPCGGSCNGTTPHCLVSGTTETCVGCTSDGDCTGATETLCEPTSHACVECLDSATCTDVGASLCDATHSCVGCGDNADCTHLTGTPVCDTAASTCVACLSNADCDATHGCDTSTNTCVTFTAASASACDECVRDAECHAGQLCVPMTYDDPTTTAADPVAVGNRCLWRQDAAGTGAPNGDCTTLPPYVRASALTSVDGVATMVCSFRESTCEAQAAFSATNCMTLDAAGDALCGVIGVHDGVCRMFGATTNRCTVFCGSDDDCPIGFACDAAASPRVCMF